MKTADKVKNLALLGKRFTSSELTSAAEYLDIDAEYIEDLICSLTEEDAIVCEDNTYRIVNPDILSLIDSHPYYGDSIHFGLACVREKADSILFHASLAGIPKRSFAARLLRYACKDFEKHPNVKLALERLKAIESLVGEQPWASRNLRIHLSEMTASGIDFSDELLRSFCEGRLYTNYHRLLRAFLHQYPQERLLEAILRRKELPCTPFQETVLRFFEARLRYLLDSGDRNAESIAETVFSVGERTRFQAALKADGLNFYGLHLRKIGDLSGFKRMIQQAIDLTERYDLELFKARFYNNLSLIYMDSNPAYSQQIQQSVIEMSRRIGDFRIAAVVSSNLALLYFFKGKRRQFNELLDDMRTYVMQTDNPEPSVFMKLTEMLPLVYEGPTDAFERVAERATADCARMVGPEKVTRINQLQMSRILHYSLFNRIEECKQVFENHDFDASDISEKALVEVIRAFVYEQENPFEVFKRFRNDMSEYVEDCLLLVSKTVAKQEYKEFRTICMERLIRAQQTVSLLSQGLLAHAVAIASERLGVVNDAIRYFRIAATHYDVSGLFETSRRLKEEHLREGELLTSLNDLVNKLDTRGLKDLKHEATKTLELVEEVSHFIVNSQNLAASLSDMNSITESMKAMLGFLLSFYPARTARCVLRWQETEEVTIGEDEIPENLEGHYSSSPFCVKYVFFVGFTGEVEIVLFNPSISVSDKLIARFFRQMTFVEPILELSFKNYIRYRMAMHDSLTGLYTRWYLEARMEEQFRRARRYEEDYSVIFCDLDDFKRVNDRYGHMRGDSTLSRVSESLKQACRESDIVCRFGGEEFVVLLPSLDLGEATVLAERLRVAVSESDPEIEVTGSFGVASYNTAEPSSSRELVQLADDLCYQAKRKGKNRVESNLDE